MEQADVNYRHNSLDVFGMIRFTQTNDRQEDLLEQTTYADTLWTQRNYQKSDEEYRELNGRIGFNCDFNDRHSIGVRYKFNAVKSKYKGTGAGQDAKARF